MDSDVANCAIVGETAHEVPQAVEAVAIEKAPVCSEEDRKVQLSSRAVEESPTTESENPEEPFAHAVEESEVEEAVLVNIVPERKKTIFLVRHAESKENVKIQTVKHVRISRFYAF